MTQMLSRRAALLGAGSIVTLGRASLAMAAAATDRRFVMVILRGALDGLSAVVPYGAPELPGLRADLVPPAPGQPGGVLDLGGHFGLHPSLPSLHAMYGSGDLLVVHAVAGAWRSRSHFEAQDHLELGTTKAITGSGWMNRVAAALPVQASGERAIAVGVELPLVLRGPTPVGLWQPPGVGQPPLDLYARLVALHSHDPVTGPAMVSGLRERGFTSQTLAGIEVPKDRGGFAQLAGSAGHLLAAADGPRLATLEVGGWDTHQGQKGRLNGLLKQLDDGLQALRDGLGDAWPHTAVLVATEFGRTVHANGTGGTDHGTASVAFLLGGRVAGGRVVRDWPGLAPSKLFEGRDLAPTTDLHALCRAVMRSHLGLDEATLRGVFPDQAGSEMAGLLRA